MPVLFFSHSHPMDEVHGGKMFWRQLNSRFRGVQTRILGSYALDIHRDFKPIRFRLAQNRSHFAKYTENMTDGTNIAAQDDLPDSATLEAAYDRALVKYFASRRAGLDDFLKANFSFVATIGLHRKALGWDMVRAPLNLALAPVQLLVSLFGHGLGRIGWPSMGRWVAARRMMFETEVQREMLRRIQFDWLELPGLGLTGLPIAPDTEIEPEQCALTRELLRDPVIAPIGVRLVERAKRDPQFSLRLSQHLGLYSEARSASSEIVVSLASTGVGAAAVGKATPTAASLGPALAGVIAQQLAISSFPLGAGLGGLYYGWFPVLPSAVLVVAATLGVMAAASVISAFAGIVSDPVQNMMGLQRRKLLALLATLEADLRKGEPGQKKKVKFSPRDRYVARLIDLADLLRTVSK